MTDNSISRLDLPYRNLILTGFVGVGKSTAGRAIAERLEVDLMDVDEEIVRREGMSITRIRQEFGDARLKILEADVCREAAFMRQAVVVVSGAALLDQRNADLLGGTGRVVCLTCEMGEALRRLHMAYEESFRDPKQHQHRPIPLNPPMSLHPTNRRIVPDSKTQQRRQNDRNPGPIRQNHLPAPFRLISS